MVDVKKAEAQLLALKEEYEQRIAKNRISFSAS